MFEFLLPYVEQGNVYNQINFSQNQYANTVGPNSPGATIVKTYLCPADVGPQQITYNQKYYFGANSYGGNPGVYGFYTTAMDQTGVFYINSSVNILSITDGTSSTFLFEERLRVDPAYDVVRGGGTSGSFAQKSGWAWANSLPGYDYLIGAAEPINWQMPAGVGDPNFIYSDARFSTPGSGHLTGANFAFADGSVKFLSQSTSLTVLQQLSTRNGGEVIDATQY